MKDIDLEDLTIQELFYLKDEWNEAYKELVEEYKDLELIHETLSHEFSKRGVTFDVAKEEDMDTEEVPTTIH